MKYPWRILSLCAMVALQFFTSGCTKTENDQILIQYSCWGTYEQQTAAQSLIDAFEARHPDIKVELSVAGYAQYFHKIQATMVGNVAPDVFMIGVDYYDEWAARGVLLDLSEDLEKLGREGAIMPIPRKAVERQGKVYGLPINVMGEVTFANLDALRKAGVAVPDEGEFTWEWIADHGARLSRRSGNPESPTEYAIAIQQPVVFLRQWGVELFDDPYRPRKTTIDHSAAIEALRFFRMLHARGFAMPLDVGMDQGATRLFRDERLAFNFGSYMLTGLLENEINFEWDVLPFPTGRTSGESMLGSVSLGVWAGSSNPDAARTFARFVASPEGARMTMKSLRTLPVYREIAYGEEFLGMTPPASMSRFSDAMEKGRASPNLYAPGNLQVSRLVNDRLVRAIIDADQPAALVVADLEKDLNRWLDRMRRRGHF